MTKNKKIIILTGMILLLAVTAVFNFLLTNGKPNDQDIITTANYFVQYKSNRITTRNEAILELNSIIDNETADEAVKTEALQQKLTIAKNMEKEFLLENYIKAKGFEDAVVIIGTDSKNVIVFVKDDELSAEEAIQIYTILREEAKIGPENAVINPIKNTSN